MENLKELMNVEYQIGKLLSNDKETVNENANKDSNTFTTRRDLMAGQVSKAKGLAMLPEKIAQAHIDGDIHFHDLNVSPLVPMTNCCLLDIEGMLENGFTMGNADVESPNSINTAVAQMTQAILSVSGEQFGGISINNIDIILGKYAEKNYLKHYEDAMSLVDSEEKAKEYAKRKTQKDIYDACQSSEYEINTLCSSQGQTPFLTFGFGFGTNWFETEIQKAILEVRLKGLGKNGKTAIFPKLIFGLKDGLNLKPSDPNYYIKELAMKCTSERMYPDYLSSKMIEEITGNVKFPMGCRSFLGRYVNNVGKEINDGRMNLGVVTLNLVRIALETNTIDEFANVFHDKVNKLIKPALEERIKSVKSAQPNNAPILYKQGGFGKKLTDNDNVEELFNNKRASISFGYIGLYEVATKFFGSEWETNKNAKEFTLDILSEMKNYCDEWSKEWDIGASVYSTPSEALTDRFCKLDTKKFGLVKDITDKEYYTNSFHYDTRKKPSPFEKIDFEKDYPKYASGGFIHFVETPSMKQNPKALESIIDYAYDRVGYFSINSPIDKCFECGFEGDFKATEDGYECPICKNNNPEKCDVVKRLCGLK